MQWYEVRYKDGSLIGRGYENRFFSKEKAFEVADRWNRNGGEKAKVYRIQHNEQEVTR